MLKKVILNSSNDVQHEIIVLLYRGVYAEELERNGVKVNLMSWNFKDIFTSYKLLVQLVKSSNIIHGWMYHANLISFFIGKMHKKNVVWGVHHSNLEFLNNKFSTLAIAYCNSIFSYGVKKIIYCGPTVCKKHESIGYDKKKSVVIPNGIELDHYVNDNISMKHKYSLVTVGRWDVLKDYSNLLEAIRLLVLRGINVQVYMVGNKLDETNLELVQMIKSKGIEKNIKLIGRIEDIRPYLYSANVFVLSSKGEGLPNVILEAMASGNIIVSTDVGDIDYAIDDKSLLVPRQDSIRLADKIEEIFQLSSEEVKSKVVKLTKRVEFFEIKSIAKKYESIYMKYGGKI